ncbi:MAG: hypothetical protein HY696_04965 [Deltaproteobacteria bacterium]|nr:hypothetical protein [Deltaproteobacteria bacterium]
MIYPFASKALFYIAGVICFLSVILAPIGFLFLYMANTAQIRIEPDRFIYKMLTTKEIPWQSITKLRILPIVRTGYRINSAPTTIATVIPLAIDHDGRTTKLSLNHFVNPNEILQTLQQKTGLRVESGEPEASSVIS